MSAADLYISGLTKQYGKFTALAPTDLKVRAGEFLTLLGPSGSGKTTLLSLIAGLSQPDAGKIMIGDRDITHRPPYERDIGMVFQNYALFPHMTISENIAFPLKMRKISKVDLSKRVEAALEMVQLSHTAKRFPKELSGGQQQRVALARCLVYRPSIILMDEPLGALDKKLRDHMQLEIKRIHRDSKTTIIYVTHDQEEAMTMSDRVCLMNTGQIEQLGSPADLYFRPRSNFVADFLGESNLLPATVENISDANIDIKIKGIEGSLSAITNNYEFFCSQSISVMIRPQNILIEAEETDRSILKARITDIMVSGSLTKLYMEPLTSDLPVLVEAHPTHAGDLKYKIGDILNVSWKSKDAIAIPTTEKLSGQ